MDLLKFVNEDQTLDYIIRNSCNLYHHRLHRAQANGGPVGEVEIVASINILLESEIAKFHIDVIKDAVRSELPKPQYLDDIRV